MLLLLKSSHVLSLYISSLHLPISQPLAGANLYKRNTQIVFFMEKTEHSCKIEIFEYTEEKVSTDINLNVIKIITVMLLLMMLSP